MDDTASESGPGSIGRNAAPLVISVEGNIGSGKSTMMEYFKGLPKHVQVVPEPTEKWKNVNGHNALELLYADIKRWSFTFNTYSQLTRLEMHLLETNRPRLMLERSLFSTQYCFVESAYQSGLLHPVEYAINKQWFEYLVKNLSLKVDLYVYIRADPQTCYRRVQERDRQEEAGLSMKYLEDLHERHESWLMRGSPSVNAPVLVLDASLSKEEMVKQYEENTNKILCTPPAIVES